MTEKIPKSALPSEHSVSLNFHHANSCASVNQHPVSISFCFFRSRIRNRNLLVIKINHPLLKAIFSHENYCFGDYSKTLESTEGTLNTWDRLHKNTKADIDVLKRN